MEATKLINFLNYHFKIHKKIEILLSQAFTTYYLNVITLILLLSEGRAGNSWEPSNKMLLFYFLIS
jgi:hypothetical protein